MVIRRGKKSRKYRGYRTHGYGNVGQHRKSGSRGGRGAVGMHKHKWSWTIKYAPDWYGKHGFTPPRRSVVKHNVINLNQLNDLVEKLVRSGRASYDGDKIVVDLRSLGINKLLGEGSVNYRVKVYVDSISESAEGKIREVGGEVVITGQGTGIG